MRSSITVPALVTTNWLAEHLADAHLGVVDVRWSLLERGKGRAAYDAGHIPGAAFLDVDGDLASPRGEGPGRHPLPTAERFAAAMSRAGVGGDTHVVAYDFGDGSTAARVWWLLRHFGHESVSLLDGGWSRWSAEGRATESVTPAIAPITFVPRARSGDLVDAEAVERLRHEPGTLVIDSRMPERYEGRTEPIDPVAGHVPLAVNHPYSRNVRGADDPRFLSPEALRERFAALGADRAERVIAYCGSGINACQNLFALHLAGFRDGLLYEGSWSDWCSTGARAVATGAG
jgi:thiosulfate/3-mercaptopyruvate sulfurtransferase